MRFEEYDYKKIKRRANLFKLITDFQKSGFKCAKLEDLQYVSAAVGARALNAACKHYKIKHIKAVIKKGDIFLINELLHSDK